MSCQDEDQDFLIAILSFNHPEHTQRALKSALNWVKPEQVACLHNGSMPRHQKQVEEAFPAIRHWHLSENRGFTSGVNEIFRRTFSTHRWLLLLTNDTQLMGRPLPPQSSGIYSPLIWRRQRGQQVDSMLGSVDLTSGQLRHLKTEAEISALSANEKIYVPGTAFWLDRESWQKVGSLDESLHTYWEDVDYSLRATDLGVKIEYFPHTELIHAVGKTCHGTSYYTNFLFHRNKRRISFRHASSEFRQTLKWNLRREAGKIYGLHLLRRDWKRLKEFHRAVRESSI